MSWVDWHPRIKRKYLTICIRRAVKDYVPQAYLGQVTLFRASEPPMGWYYMGQDFPTPDDWYDRDPQYGWGALAGGGLECHDVTGNHGTMLKEPHVENLANQLRAWLDAAFHAAELSRSNVVLKSQ